MVFFGFERKDIFKLIWIGIKVSVVLFAVFHGTNVSILYQGF